MEASYLPGRLQTGMASWPKGNRPKVPFPYFAETITWFEYIVAIGMLYEGMEKEKSIYGWIP